MWIELSENDKTIFADQLISVVGRTYSRTRFGSFVRTLDDVIASNWFAFIVDERVVACIFYRHARQLDLWTGNKIQGIGQDGTDKAKEIVLSKLRELLEIDGWWIETGGALRIRLLKDGIHAVNEPILLRRLFKDPNLTMVSDHTYTRMIGDDMIRESSFGRPKIKMSW